MLARPRLRPLPNPYQPGSMCRLCVQANTQGIGAQRFDALAARRRTAGRDPMCMRSMTSSGVAARKISMKRGSPNTRSR